MAATLITTFDIYCVHPARKNAIPLKFNGAVNSFDKRCKCITGLPVDCYAPGEKLALVTSRVIRSTRFPKIDFSFPALITNRSRVVCATSFPVSRRTMERFRQRENIFLIPSRDVSRFALQISRFFAGTKIRQKARLKT